MISIAYSRRSQPSAEAIASELNNSRLVRSSSEEVDINWGRATANAKLNPDISSVTDKRRMRGLFEEKGVPSPRLFTLREVGLQLDEYGDTVKFIGRPDNHTKGRGLWKIRNKRDLRQAVRGTRRKRAATHFMEYINAPREYRVHVFLGRSIRISEKIFGTTGETAHGKYTTGRPRHEVGHVRQAAKEAVAAVGLDFGAVDVLADDDDCWVLEVNSAPGVGGSMPRLYADKFARWREELWI